LFTDESLRRGFNSGLSPRQLLARNGKTAALVDASE
jgi:hypothetical protein